MSAELVGLEAFQQKAAAVAASVEVRAREVAHGSVNRVADAVRARVRHAAAARLRAAVRVIEAPEQRQFAVGFDDMALIASGLMAMVPIWHEFGTRFMVANPALGDAVTADRTQYVDEMRAAVTDVLEEGSR